MSDWLERVMNDFTRIASVVLFSFAIAACGGGNSDGGGTNPPPGGGGGGGGGIDDDPPTAKVSPAGALGAKERIVIEFSESMEPDSLDIGGTLASGFEPEWSRTETENDTLTLAPVSYWPGGNRSLTVRAQNADGESAEAETEFTVAPAFNNTRDAVLVIGQPDFVSGESRQGAEFAHANTLDEPLGSAAYAPDSDVLFITDTWDSRVLGFYGIPEVNNANADFVLGQPGFNTSMGRVAHDGMVSPQYVSVDHGRLIVSDTEAYRVAIYDGIPEGAGALPSVVVGQPDFETRIDRPPCDERTLNHLHSHFLTESGKLLVASSWQNRVLIWNELPDENYQPADMVLGQPDMTSCEDVPNSLRFRHPTDIWTDEQRLLILDSEKHRLLIWNEFPTENFAEPDVVLGQSNFTNEAPNDDNQDGQPDEQASARVMDYPRSLWVDEHGQLFVADMNNHRILIWHEIPSESFTPADAVVGQPDFQATGGVEEISDDPTSARTFNSPTGVSVIGDKLFVTERFNHRVVAFKAE